MTTDAHPGQRDLLGRIEGAIPAGQGCAAKVETDARAFYHPELAQGRLEREIASGRYGNGPMTGYAVRC